MEDSDSTKQIKRLLTRHYDMSQLRTSEQVWARSISRPENPKRLCSIYPAVDISTWRPIYCRLLAGDLQDFGFPPEELETSLSYLP